MFFTALEGLLAERALMMTVSRDEHGILLLNVIPQQIKNDKDDAVRNKPALLEPLSVSGRAEELDAELPKLLADYTDSYKGLVSNLAEVTKLQAETAKAEKEAAASKAAAAKSKAQGKPGTKTADAKPEPAKKADISQAGSLFLSIPLESGDGAAQPTQLAAATVAPALDSAASDNDMIGDTEADAIENEEDSDEDDAAERLLEAESSDEDAVAV